MKEWGPVNRLVCRAGWGLSRPPAGCGQQDAPADGKAWSGARRGALVGDPVAERQVVVGGGAVCHRVPGIGVPEGRPARGLPVIHPPAW